MYKNFQEMRENLQALPPRSIVVAAAHESHTLEAVFAAASELPMKYLLVGDRGRILEISSELGTTVHESMIIDGGDDIECAQKAVNLIRDGRGDVLMKGKLDTATLLRAALNNSTGIKDSTTVSHIAILEVPHYHKLIAITDAGILPNPTLEQKAEIVRNAVKFYHKMGFPHPKVAALCASEILNEKIIETVDAHHLQKMCEAGELGDCLLEGPISFDLAISTKSAEEKGYHSAISGDVDILHVPGITAGNLLSKGLIYWGDAIMAGCVLGAKVPIALMSRAASPTGKLYSIMLCLNAGTTS